MLHINEKEWKEFSVERKIPLQKLEESLIDKFSTSVKSRRSGMSEEEAKEIAGKLIGRRIVDVLIYAQSLDVDLSDIGV